MNILPNSLNQYSNLNRENLTQTNKVGIENNSLSKNPSDIIKEEDLKKNLSPSAEKRLKEIGALECSTCASRQYIDGSDDPSVSFKTGGNISPESSYSVVRGHEQEHVSNESARAKSENKEVVSQSVVLTSSSCPECGKVYVSGGTTETVTKTKPEESVYTSDSEDLKGNFVNAIA